MWNINVTVIKPGTSTIPPGNMASQVHVGLMHRIGIGGGSTVSLIREGDDCLLIDTGYENESDQSPENQRRNRDRLKLLLGFHGHRIEEITKVFITHFHMDHFGGIELFQDAEWFCHRSAYDALNSPLKERFIPLDDGELLLPNTSVLHTPGHTFGHASILWTNENRSLKVTVCGDAIINLDWLRSGRIWKFNNDFFDADATRKSIANVLDWANLIIPGHGQPFFTSTLAP